jgi:hypothetical protein
MQFGGRCNPEAVREQDSDDSWHSRRYPAGKTLMHACAEKKFRQWAPSTALVYRYTLHKPGTAAVHGS